MKSACVVIAGALGALCLAACEENEIEAPGEESTLEAVREDAAALAESTGEALKEGMGELKEGAADAAALAKGAGAELKDAGADLRDVVKKDEAK